MPVVVSRNALWRVGEKELRWLFFPAKLPITLLSSREFKELRFGLINCDGILANSRYRAESGATSRLTIRDWSLKISPVDESWRARFAPAETLLYRCTHTCSLSKSDPTLLFKVGEAQSILESLALALSLDTGRQVGPAFVEGLEPDGKFVMCEWGTRPIDPSTSAPPERDVGTPHWLDCLESFVTAESHPRTRDLLRKSVRVLTSSSLKELPAERQILIWSVLQELKKLQDEPMQTERASSAHKLFNAGPFSSISQKSNQAGCSREDVTKRVDNPLEDLSRKGSQDSQLESELAELLFDLLLQVQSVGLSTSTIAYNLTNEIGDNLRCF